ncbi:carbohydrate kinase family protein [Halopiger djelfimassiliensis]|uniref:carbohydrate kinase family protein n=1 Tax=Halopiger djelfimassiliensis TaxID=1293047 RepID=UPI0006776DE9|nr:carbohydrate kinase [Halopiger djelfimassiliensis]
MARDPDLTVLVAGETLIDFLPERPGSLASVERFERRPGGAPANVAVGLARLAAPPLFWTRVGDDPFGHYLERQLVDYGLPDRFIERDPVAKTTLAFVTHDDAGERTFTFYRDGTADTRLEPGRIDDATLEVLEWVHLGGVTLATGSARAATMDLLERASDAGCTVSFDPNHRPELWHDDGTFVEVVRGVFPHIDVCKATVGELERLGFDGETPSALARAAIEHGPQVCFVTRGSEGALAVAEPSSPWTGPDDSSSDPIVAEFGGYDVDAVDTTGAGDAFVAGAITALRGATSLEKTLAFACAVAAIATTEPGAMAALPDRESVRAFRRERSESR